ncbi:MULTISPECIES: hypothetical protein [Pseudomonas]|uniref:Uncharacterized protein n=1 Tax=Pseudomonas lurida TaxID=244566 RepID=A0ABY9FME3_9PSED|nr:MULTISPECIES: hypothetical protein [Pseudomonas]AVJ38693.1 hypothetical protein CLM75_15595 [Pseudomonas lurida]PRA11697.1 hypothetical protein CQ002_26295 [Pseudomonas sp. MYb13]PRA15389.1 hypothetical protein CQ004_27385 [Pseudomonas lurida]PRA27418.1 hypothetical protein CQ005_26975 [Pseudomonas lurida]PRB94308.1 hypothetical protein CQ014_27065 [Pseudomonas lurida]
MKKLDITIIKNAQRETATLELDRTTSTLSITFADGMQKTYSDTDIYTCLGLKIRKFSEITFLCKGSKINVYPSAMVSQMSSGVVAYEVTVGDPDAELVRIFDYEENNLTNDINEQIAYRLKWSDSLQRS